MGVRTQQVLDTAVANFYQTTGIKARVLGAVGPTGDAIVEFRTDDQKLRFAAKIKVVDRFETPAMLKAGPNNPMERPMLVAPYVTREMAERCRDLELPFIDTAGNAYIKGPGLFIYVVGRRRPAEMRQDRFRALNPAGLRIAFALLCRPELARANYREIARAARVALGTVGPVIKDLAGRGLLRLNAATERGILDPERMLQEWVTHYPTTLRPKLNPRRFQADVNALQQAKIQRYEAYWGGEVAAEMLTHILKPASFTIYARGPIAKLVAAGRMRADSTGNVEVLEAFWDFDAATVDPGLAPPVLVYADLLATNDGRNAEAARLVYEQRIEPTFNHPA